MSLKVREMILSRSRVLDIPDDLVERLILHDQVGMLGWLASTACDRTDTVESLSALSIALDVPYNRVKNAYYRRRSADTPESYASVASKILSLTPGHCNGFWASILRHAYKACKYIAVEEWLKEGVTIGDISTLHAVRISHTKIYELRRSIMQIERDTL